MRNLLYLIVIFTVLLACQQKSPSKIDIKKADATKQKQDLVRQQIKTDSLQLIADSLQEVSIVNAALNYARKHIADLPYNKKVNVLDTFTVRLSFGNLFEGKRKHLYIFDERNNYVYMNIYSLEKNDFLDLLSETEWGMNFTEHEIKDVNGDGLKDFIYHYYPSSGCCIRDINKVYLYKRSHRFTDFYKIPNPTFFPKEKIIRGVEYGHPGEVPLYKFKWNGERLDTIEYIYPADTLQKKFYRVARWGDQDVASKRKVLNYIPAEYKKINGFDWFIGY